MIRSRKKIYELVEVDTFNGERYRNLKGRVKKF